ncbi:MAG: hypothetical protein WCO56_27500 [Verrucomicrobiota bacterium]
MRAYLSILYAAWAIVFFEGCVSVSVHPAPSIQHPKDAWVRFSNIADFIDAKETDILAPELVHQIPQFKRPASELLLRWSPCIEISSAKATELFGYALAPSQGKRLFLTRGLCCNRETGDFAVMYFRGSLEVQHCSMGSSFGPMERQPLILELPQKPKHVYVSCAVLQ